MACDFAGCLQKLARKVPSLFLSASYSVVVRTAADNIATEDAEKHLGRAVSGKNLGVAAVS